MSAISDDVEAGRAAWARLRGRQRKNWADWLAVGAALVVGRASAMKLAQTNKPFGSKYNSAMGQWLRTHGFDEISTQERYRAILCAENRVAIEAWRSNLDDGTQRRFNHPGAVWHAWRRSHLPVLRELGPEHRLGGGRQRPEPRPANAKGYPRVLFWPGEMIRRAAIAMIEARSTDYFVMAKLALEAAVRDQDDIAELLDSKPQSASKAARQTRSMTPSIGRDGANGRL